MKSYYRVILGRGHKYAKFCREENFIGTDFGINRDLTEDFKLDRTAFSKKCIPEHRQIRPDKSKGSAALACGALWTVSKGISVDDIVLCPDGERAYMVGEVTGEYQYSPGEGLIHIRNVKWFNSLIQRDDMSENLRNSSGSIGTVCNVSKYSEEIESLMNGFKQKSSSLVSLDESVGDPSAFALEKHLEDFLVANWSNIDLGKQYDLYTDGEETNGQQFLTDTGPLDILCISKNRKELLVVELKKGRASDAVVGQVQRYMGFVQDVVAESNQTVKGVIIALEDCQRIKRALSVTQNIEFYKYQIDFRLDKAA